MPRRRDVLQPPMELAATGTYTMPDRDASKTNGQKTVVVVLEIYSNASSSGSATLSIQTGTDTPPKPYTHGADGGYITPTGGTFTIAATTVGVQQPITLSALADNLRFAVTPNTLNGIIRFSITVYYTDV